MLPKKTSVAVVEHELKGVRAWAERRSVPLEWHAATLELSVTLRQPVTGEVFYLRGRFESYRAQPPAWLF